MNVIDRSYVESENAVKAKITDKQRDINEAKTRYEELGEKPGVEEYGELNSALKQKITRFFRDFDIIKEYDSDNLETAFQIIAEEWSKLERNYMATQAENKVKIPMYKEIVKYLSQEDILEEDRAAYTRELYNSANVFGITCTSRDRFTPAQLEELGRYGIESVDIRTVGIDVVIIDEVSKSSFLDLLIPILYGKTIILVGDHRQLPPMYDLRHMRADDFEGLDEEIITKEINDGYTKLYEECFFKTLYEKVPKEFKVMLNKQYRCHSHIMEVFNHFYGGSNKGLVVGKKQQDDEKEHNLTVRINGNTVIDPIHHLFFDIECCDGAHICEFGYVLTNDKFEILDRDFFLINPERKFNLTGRKDQRDLQLHFSEEEYYNSPLFTEYYGRIKNLIEAKDQLVIGHAISNDAGFLRTACRIYKRPPINFEFYDSQKMYSEFFNNKSSISLEKAGEKLHLEKVKYLHKSDDIITTKAFVLKRHDCLFCFLQKNFHSGVNFICFHGF